MSPADSYLRQLGRAVADATPEDARRACQGLDRRELRAVAAEAAVERVRRGERVTVSAVEAEIS